MATVYRVSSIHDSGTEIATFDSRDQAESYVSSLEALEAEEMDDDGYWYEVV